MIYIYESAVQMPDAMTISHGPITPGSTVRLTCTVVLNSDSVDVPVTVNTDWTGPAGFMTTNSAQPVNNNMGSTTNYRYTSTAMVDSFRRHNSGEYVCSATTRANSSPLLTDSDPRSETATVSVGMIIINF
jgi:hypothetical protein